MASTLCANINRNRRMDVPPDQGRVSKSILPRKTGLFKIAQCKVLGRTHFMSLNHVCIQRHSDGLFFGMCYRLKEMRGEFD